MTPSFFLAKGATTNIPEGPEPAGVANKLEQDPSYAESENIGEVATPEPTLENPPTIRQPASVLSSDRLLTADDRWRF